MTNAMIYKRLRKLGIPARTAKQIIKTVYNGDRLVVRDKAKLISYCDYIRYRR